MTKNTISKKKVIFFSPSRSDFGIISNLLSMFTMEGNIECNLMVTGSHLDKKFGNTLKEVNTNHYDNLFKIQMDGLGSEHTSLMIDGISKMMREVGEIIFDLKPDLFIVLGDRQEILPASYCALLNNIPIAHIGGGDVTDGAIDNQVRHAVSQISTFHFVTNLDAQQRLIKMNIPHKNIFFTGSPSDTKLEVTQKKSVSKSAILEKLGIIQKERIILCTFHPETKNPHSFKDLFVFAEALKSLPQDKFCIVFTASNGDKDGLEFNKFIKSEVIENDNFYFFASLGIDLYLELMRISDLVAGNSSSGLHEAPSLKTPTLDIGNRQGGRVRGDSVFNVVARKSDIIDKVNEILKIKSLLKYNNPYIDEGNSSTKIFNALLLMLDE